MGVLLRLAFPRFLIAGCLLAVVTLPCGVPVAAQTPALPPALPAAPAAKGANDTPEPDPARRWPTVYPGGTATPLGKRIASLLSEAAVARAHWGIAVTTMEGVPVFGLEEGKLFRPASTTKLFTTAAAMAILGPESTITTGIYGAFDKSTGRVTGNLVLVGAGDPSFGTTDLPYRYPVREDASVTPGTEDLRALTDQLVAIGLREVTGDVVADTTLFSPASAPEGWAEEDLLWGYGALPNALAFADNEVAITVTPGPSHEPVSAGTALAALVQVDQLVPYLDIRSHILTRPSSTQPDEVSWSRSKTAPAAIEANGWVTSGHAALHERFALPDPALYTAQALQAQLLQKGIQAGGPPAVLAAAPQAPRPFLATLRSEDSCGTAALGGPGGCALDCLATPHPSQLLASHVSPPLQQEIAFTLKTSANLHAELILDRLGLKEACPGASTLDGARLVRTWMLRNGIADHDVTLYDGSGLSTKDLVTPRAEAQLLAYAATQPWFAAWKAGLPVGGVDGTLANRFIQSALKGKVFAKTGTLGESRALAGYVRCASGRELIFAILDDNHQPGSAADRIAMDRIVEAIAELN